MVLINTSAYENAYGIAYNPDQVQQVEQFNDGRQYSYLPENQRVYLRSHMYGGTHHREERTALVFNPKDKNFVYRKLTTPKLQERLFLELISNAVDNAFRSHAKGIHAPTLDVEMDKDTISVRSTGQPIPVDLHKYYTSQGLKGTSAELIFSKIGGGSNMDDSKVRQGGGVNGVGATLCNIFSRFYNVEIGDNVRGFRQSITWSHNMTQKVSDIIEPAYNITPYPDNDGFYHLVHINPNERYTGENYVKVTFKCDFRKFGCTCYSEDDLFLYMKYVAEASFIAKFRATFNGMDISMGTPTQFINALPKNIQRNSLVHYEFSKPLPQNVTQAQIENAVSSLQLIPDVEMIIFDTPGQDNFEIAYANGVWNSKGGAHVDELHKSLLDVIKQCIGSMKGMGEVDLSKLTIRDIRGQCSFIISCRCNSPEFVGQDKETFVKPKPKINYTADEVAKIKKFELTKVIHRIITGKVLKNYVVNNGRFKTEDDFRDADWFGTPRQKECVMLICEGKSAGTYLKDWIYGTKERTNKYCYMLLRGKLLNVSGKDLIELLDPKHGNDVIRNIVKYMGLEFGVDYRTPEGASRLRYQELWSLTDSDSDGFHIHGLITNVLHIFFPTFLLSGRFKFVPTPVIRILTSVKKGTTKRIFYTMSEYNAYKKSTGDNNHHSKHFKGLASGGKEFAKEDAKVSPIVICNYDNYAPYTINLVFGKDRDSSDKRKIWIENCRSIIDTDIIRDFGSPNPREKYVNISDYLNTRLVEYSIDSLKRALPCAFDGLKLSQRQSLWHILVDWKYGKSSKGTKNLATIAGEAKTATKYHHGDLAPTIARLATRFPGSNNVPLMSVHEGQFGSREANGNDIGAARYISTDPEDVIKLIFDEELTDLIPRNVEEGKEVESVWLPSRISLLGMNGCLGVATAYSIDHPQYNPKDLTQWTINYISGQKVFPMMPWFAGFNGIVELEYVKGKHKADNQLTNSQVEYYEGLTLVTKGLFQVVAQRNAIYDIDDPNNPGKKKRVGGVVSDILITEIPIGIATETYVKWLETKCEKVDKSGTVTTDTPILMVIGWRDEISHKSLRLIRRQGINNITVIDNNGIPLQLKNTYQALKIYCDNMMNLYRELKEKRLSDLREKIKEEETMCKLIELVITERILVFKQKRAFIFQQMAQHNIENRFYEKVGLKGLDEDGYNDHKEKLQNLLIKYNEIEQKHYLYDWCEDLKKLYDFFSADPRYNKLPHHEYPFVYTDIDDLLTGKVKSPFALKEEVQPQPLNNTQNIVTDQNGVKWIYDESTGQYSQYNIETAIKNMQEYIDPTTGQTVYYDANLSPEQIQAQIQEQVTAQLEKIKNNTEQPQFIKPPLVDQFNNMSLVSGVI